MPEAWTAKDERQYKHIQASEKKEGRSAKVAKHIAAATVNKQRSSEGRTLEQRATASTKKATKKKSTKKKAAKKKSAPRKKSSRA